MDILRIPGSLDRTRHHVYNGEHRFLVIGVCLAVRLMGRKWSDEYVVADVIQEMRE